MEKEYLKKLKIVNVKKGDIVVLFLKTQLSKNAGEKILHQIKELFPNNKVIVLEEGLKMKIYRNVAIQKQRK